MVSKVRIARGKVEGIDACANERGVISAAAMDQRGSLQKAIGKARADSSATAADLAVFKEAVVSTLTPYASAILLDPEFGLRAMEVKAPNTGVLLAYEKTGYDATVKGRLPDLLDDWSVRRLVETGANAIKILLYYDPADDESVNTIKHAFIERVGSECMALDVPFFLEPVTYRDGVSGLDWAKAKPEAVTRTMAEFSNDRYGVDILKVEVPIDMKFVSGTQSFTGEAAYTRDDALRLFQEMSDAATKPFIFLCAGSATNSSWKPCCWPPNREPTTPAFFAGVPPGRWRTHLRPRGLDALKAWLETQGVANIQRSTTRLPPGRNPGETIYGGNDGIEVFDPVLE